MDRANERLAWYVFLAILLACAAAAGLFLSGRAGTVTYELRTGEPVSGLITGAPVEFHGVEVGQVHDVRLLDPRTVQVLLRVRRDAPVTTATVATITGRGIAARGFTGYVYVSLEDAAAGGAALPIPPGEPYPRIATAPVRSASLDYSVNQLNASMQSMMALLQQTLDARTVAALKATAGHVEQVSGSLASNDARLRAIIANTEKASGRLGPLLQSGDRALGTLQDRVLPQAQETLLRFDGVAGTANLALHNVETASAGLGPLVESGDRVMRSMETQVLPQTMQELRQADDLLLTMNVAAANIRDNPSSLIWGRRATRTVAGTCH
ncbi:MlaD family protein [Ramlibacter humi]|uniref:MCE family protein n=1 Tax=Ramlibacter humi TaxID=2530451 RepID=A0A4Z0BNQ0_9BURK|nr:MlaD family protein [Ramlibacter humi]TFZ00050.1 MCE family protein [Ramlibacter humi]